MSYPLYEESTRSSKPERTSTWLLILIILLTVLTSCVTGQGSRRSLGVNGYELAVDIPDTPVITFMPYTESVLLEDGTETDVVVRSKMDDISIRKYIKKMRRELDSLAEALK